MTLITDERGLTAIAERLATASTIAVDIESNGLFKYRAGLCTVQLAIEGEEPIIVDTMATSLLPLRAILSVDGPRKLVHDVAFDARILAESGIALGNVFDTSLAARMLGRTATGLASLLMSDLGITVDKKLQHHDWTQRPLLAHHVKYLADDVRHLPALAEKLRLEVFERGIADEIEEETRYRLGQAATSVKEGDPRPPYIRMKGVDKIPKEELPLLRHLADAREAMARSLDVPPYKVIGPDVLFAIAKAKPTTMDELAKVKGALNGHRARQIARQLLAAVATGLADAGIPEVDAAFLERPRIPQSIVKARRTREQRLNAWRRAEAKLRAVDEQVVLPGHCLQDLADLEAPVLEDLATVPGIGAFRVAQHGPAILGALLGTGPELTEEPAVDE